MVNSTGRSLGGIDGVAGSNLRGTVLPLRSQGQLGSGLIQNRNRSLGTLLSIHQIPAKEVISGLRGHQRQLGRGGGNIDKRAHGVAEGIGYIAAIAVQNNICIGGGRSAGIDIVQVHIGFRKPPVHQAPEIIRVGIAAIVQTDRIQEIIALLAIDYDVTQRTI